MLHPSPGTILFGVSGPGPLWGCAMVPFVLGAGKAAGMGNHCSLVKEHSAPQGNHKELQVLPPRLVPD